MKKFWEKIKEIWSKIAKPFKKADAAIDKGVDIAVSPFKKLFFEHKYAIYLIVITAFALAFRYLFAPFITADFNNFIHRWALFINQNGQFVEGVKNLYEAEGSALRVTIASQGVFGVPTCDYPPLYMYLISLVSMLPLGDLVQPEQYTYIVHGNLLYYVKTISFIFEIIGAIYCYKIVKKVTNSKLNASIAYSVYFFLPTIFMNSALWGQCDICYASMVLASFYYIISRKQIKSMVFFGLALAFKVQCIFLIPLFGFLWFRKGFKLRYIVVAALVTFATFLPLYFAGAQFGTPFLPYIRQFGGYANRVNLNSTSMYAWFDLLNEKGMDLDASIKALSTFGIIFTIVVCLTFISILAFRRVKITEKSVFTIGIMCFVLVPFVMPHMHERYFYLAEVGMLLYACTNIKRIHLPVMQQVSGLIAYSAYGLVFSPNWWLNNSNGSKIGLVIGSFLNVGVMLFLIMDIAKLETEPKMLAPVEGKIEESAANIEQKTDENNTENK